MKIHMNMEILLTEIGIRTLFSLYKVLVLIVF